MKIDNPVEFTLDFGGKESFELGLKHRVELTVKPKIDITVEEIGYRLVVESRGSLIHYSKIISDTQLSDSIELKAGTRYPLEFFLFNDLSPTYNGKNVSFLYKLVPYILLTPKDIKKTTFISLFVGKDDGIRKEEKFLTFVNAPEVYQVQSTKIKLVQDLFQKIVGSIFSIGLFLIMLYFFLGKGFDFLENYLSVIFLTIGVLAFLIICYIILGKSLIGDVKAKIRPMDSEFIEVSIKSNWGLVRSISVYYLIEEEVKDKRGTSSSVHREIYEKSPVREIDRPHGTITTTLENPKQIMPSIELGDAKINWFLVAEVKTSIGIPFIYKGEFKVSNKNIHS